MDVGKKRIPVFVVVSLSVVQLSSVLTPDHSSSLWFRFSLSLSLYFDHSLFLSLCILSPLRKRSMMAMESRDRSSLTAPLLAEQGIPISGGNDADDKADDVILDIRDAESLQGNGLLEGYSSESVEDDVEAAKGDDDNPFEFLGAVPFQFPRRPCSLDPFRNHRPKLEGIYEILKTVICLPLAIARLILFGLALALGFLATTLALHGWKDTQSPLPKWRSRFMWITRICARCILFSFGYHWIKRKGRPASRGLAPIVVSNHVSYIEPIFFFYELFPTIVASVTHDSIPFVGTIIRSMQVIYVDRFSAMSRKHAVNEIKRKASSSEFPRVLLFPEGTTTNGRAIISFQLGAFIPGVPVQPVIVRYPYVHFDQSWGLISLTWLMIRMFTQFHNFMEVEYLPVIFPSEKKLETASEFAERAGHIMATALDVVQTSHSYGDVMLLAKASEHTKGKLSAYMVEMAWVESSINVTTSEALELLDSFLAMKPDSNGRIDFVDFLASMHLGPPSPLSEKVFRFVDVENKGFITFRQFLVGSGSILKRPAFQRTCEAIFDECSHESLLSREKLGEIIQSAVPGISLESLHELFSSFDVDQDGVINKVDFMGYLQKNPLMIAFFPIQRMPHGSVEVYY